MNKKVNGIVIFFLILFLSTAVFAEICIGPNDGSTSETACTISNCSELDAIRYHIDLASEDYAQYFILTGDINCEMTQNLEYNGGQGFAPIADDTTPFSGSLDGNGNTISGLHINLPGSYEFGLFKQTLNAEIKNINFVDLYVTGSYDVGGLVYYAVDSNIIGVSVTGNIIDSDPGRLNYPNYEIGGLVAWSENVIISDSNFYGTIVGFLDVGGLVGFADNTTISNSFVSANIFGGNELGLIVGMCTYCTINDTNGIGNIDMNYDSIGQSAGLIVGAAYDTVIERVFTDGNIIGIASLGGIVGEFGSYDSGYNTAIINSYSTASITGLTNSVDIGGLVGLMAGGNIILSYSKNPYITSVGENIGGLVGFISADVNILDSYAKDVNLTGNYGIGGLVGFGTSSNIFINNSYATGIINGNQDIGGIISGDNTFTGGVADSFAVIDFSNTVNNYIIGNIDSTLYQNLWWYNTSIYDYLDINNSELYKASNSSDFYSDINTDIFEDWNTEIWNFSGTDYPALFWQGLGSTSGGDTTPPVFDAYSDINSEATSSAGSNVAFSLPTATDAVDGSVLVTCDANSGDLFLIGSTDVNCSATDSSSNTTTMSFTINVQDTTGPVFDPYIDINSEATSSAGSNVAFSLPTATDAVDGSVLVTCDANSGDLFLIGSTDVNCSATDSSSNITTMSFIITVNLDTDGDGHIDDLDPLWYVEEDVNSEGLNGDLNITVGGQTTGEIITGLKRVIFKDGDIPFLHFDFNFDVNKLYLNKIKVRKTINSIHVDLNGQIQEDQKLTGYLKNNNFTNICVKNVPVVDISEISEKCNSANEYDFTNCLNGSHSTNGIICTLTGETIEISNLDYLAIRGVRNISGGRRILSVPYTISPNLEEQLIVDENLSNINVTDGSGTRITEHTIEPNNEEESLENIIINHSDVNYNNKNQNHPIIYKRDENLESNILTFIIIGLLIFGLIVGIFWSNFIKKKK